ncbi:PREDICTED: CMRF35-like molecule 8 [Tinamus guttatus]|uniref:CMRF35-like molecule 8 n=1 Tax=Tinamus guttatus TaxID=94827 RepID=UPI00052E7184|nr:PREDICTED: CMRF35-like molecule 8 [Tinamus guttatus]
MPRQPEHSQNGNLARAAGCWALTGPHSVQGTVGGSLSVSCKYEEGLETNEKFWCKPGSFLSCDGPYIIATSEHKSFAHKERISIVDDQTRQVFTVTMRNLTTGDTGTYRCGVERTLLNDRHTVKVNVFPEKSREVSLGGECGGTAVLPAAELTSRAGCARVRVCRAGKRSHAGSEAT